MPSVPPEVPLTSLAHRALLGDADWQDFLDEARQVLPNGKAVLFFHDAGSARGAFSFASGTEEGFRRAYEAYYARINPWMPHAAIRPLGRVVQADRMLPRAELTKTEFYADFLAPQGLETGLGVTIRRENGCNFLFSVLGADCEEAEMRQAQHTLQSVVPALRLAFETYRRRPDLLGEPGGLAGLRPALARLRVGPGLRVTHADDEAVRLLGTAPCLSLDPAGRLRCGLPAVAEWIEAELAAWGMDAAPTQRVFHLPRPGGELPLRLTVLRPDGRGVSYFRGPECAILLEDPAASIPVAVAEFCRMHGLSRAEARVVAGLVRGLTPVEIAAESGVSLPTVKTQLRGIFERTGLRRQVDVVRHVCIMA
jgi:DNA-binding CsgD family transcriptional regulator